MTLYKKYTKYIHLWFKLPISTTVNIEHINLIKVYMHDACDHVYMYRGRDENTNFHVEIVALTKDSTKHISNTYGGAM